MDLGTMTKRIQNIMRQDAGVNGDAQRIEQLVWMLFLKLYDAKEMEWEIIDDNYKSIIPEAYRWRNWAIDNKDGKAITGDELLNFINQLFITLKDLEVTEYTDKRSIIVKEVFSDLNNYMKDGVLIRQVINVLNEVDLTDFRNRHAFNEIYETMLKELQSAGKSGEFYTPRALTEFIVRAINPEVGNSIADFACGTGGFLISALKLLQENADDIKSREVIDKSLYGVEKKSLPYLLCMTNLLLHDINEPKIEHKNSLEKNVRDYEDDDKFDIIIMNPPYGGTEKREIQNNFPLELRSSETADLFMIEILYRLNRDGKAGVILPDGFLNGAGNKSKIREKLLNECNLHTIVRLPNSVFKPYATVATNILFFDKGQPTKEVWYYEHKVPTGIKGYSKTKPIEFKEFKKELSWWNNRVENENAWKVSIDEIKSNDFNLDIKNPNNKEEIKEYSIQELIDDIVKNQNEITNILNEIKGEIDGNA